MDGEPILFTVSIGQGHNQAARALKEELEKHGFSQVHVIDTFHYIHPLLHSSIASLYRLVVRYTPSVWEAIFKEHRHRCALFRHYEKMLRLISKPIERLIVETNPPFIISTHPSATWLVAIVKEKNGWSIPLYSVITDFRLHPTYVHQQVTSYFTIDEAAKTFALSVGLNPSSFHQTGIPFPMKPPDVHEMMQFRQSLQIDPNRAVVVIAGGGLGLTSYHVILEELEKITTPLTIFCMIGHNDDAKKKLTNYCSHHDIRIISYTDQFVSYLAISDVVITKAGGLTLTEALSCEVPVVLYEPLPGHERLNAKLAVRWGFAVHAADQDEIALYVQRILSDPILKTKMKLSARRHKKENAAYQIVKTITYPLTSVPANNWSRE